MPNHLASETSPYLLQHADNPVDWWPWGEQALALARAQDKPILLSIGYSACHWCHVMAHESFEDAQVAAVMNELFVNVKVDREERPDLDQIYQVAHHMLTERSGGWPLTLFLTPDTTPFFGGTYFPKNARHGMTGFLDLLPRVAAFYRERRADIEQQNASLVHALDQTLPRSAAAELSPAPLGQAVRELQGMFDSRYGGFGRAPKFPHPFELQFCLARAIDAPEEGTLDLVKTTLTRMAEGGIYDQLGGGFCRYSVDQYWSIPHFEKMLYDNGPLLALYTDAFSVTREPLFAHVAAETAQWVMREMQSPAGGYYSTLDADSEHEEGKFYVWTPDEVKALLSADEFAVVEPHYGLDGAPNFEGRHWHLRVVKPLEFVATRSGKPLAECERLLGEARPKLLAVRSKRVWPGRDEKILTSWNALMVKGMARAARVFDRADWLASARRALGFVRSTLWINGRLLATHKDGKTHLNAYLDDHAFLLDALLETMQAEFDPADLDFARALADVLLAQFEDSTAGGFFFTSHDHEKLIHRGKPGYDNATPSGNGVAAYALQRLGHLIGEPRYLAAAERTLRLFYPSLEARPSAFPSLCSALAEYVEPPRSVVLSGPAADAQSWRRVLAGEYRPHALILAVDAGAQGLPATLDKPAGATVNAWVCAGVKCLAPIADRGALESVLRESELG